MKNQETNLGGPDRRFPTTSYSILKLLRDPESAQYDDALQRLLSMYWKPVYCLVRHSWGKTNEEAKDLTQDFFLSMVLEKSLVRKFVAERGSFRAFLKASVTNFLRDAAKSAGRQKRGGDARLVPLHTDGFELADMIPDAGTLTPEQVFDAAWKNLVLARALELLEKRLTEQDKAAYFQVFQRYDIHPEAPDVSYKTVGQSLGLSPDAVKNYLTLAREEFRIAVSDVVSDTIDNPADLSAEIEELFGS